MKIYGITGWKNAGKTTLTERLVAHFAGQGLRVSTVKHAHHDTEIDHPGPTWLVGDLAELDLAAEGVEGDFDVIISAGNVMGFLAPSTRVEVLRRFGTHLAEDGRAIIGFGGGRGYEFADFFADLDAAGLRLDLALSTWDLRPFTAQSDFLVALCCRA